MAGRAFDITDQYFRHGIGALAVTGKYGCFCGSKPN
jgi:hypothetical protein